MKAYSYEDINDPGFQRAVLAACEDVKNRNPTAWRQAHNGRFDEASNRYNDLCVQELRARGIFAGANGKRGDANNRSDDILTFGLTDGRGARDTSGRFASIAIIDYIGNGGGFNLNPPKTPYLTWGDVSAAAPGCFLDPLGLGSIDGAGTPVPGPTPTPTPTPAPNLAALEARIGALEAHNLQLQTMLGNALAGIGAVATQIGDLRSALLDGDGAIDRMTKRIFGVDGSDNAGVAEEVVIRLQNLEPKERTGALEGCRVVSYLRR